MMDQEGKARVQTLLAAFRQIGMPLVHALVEQESQGNVKVSPEMLNELIDNTLALSQSVASDLDVEFDDLDDKEKWNLTGAASQIVGAGYSAWGKSLDAEKIAALSKAAAALEARFKNDAPATPDLMPNDLMSFRSKMMEAMVPVVGAVAQYSFGRSEHLLLSDIADRLVKTADQVTRTLAPSGASAAEWRLLCWNILRAAGQTYADSHFAEADRLLYMEEEDRSAYFAEHDHVPPMTQVWQAFEQRMAMLATLAHYLEVPAGAEFEEGGLA